MSDQTPDDAAQAAEWLYPALSNDDEELTYPRSAFRQGKRDAYLRGRADERARIVREMREYISRDQSTVFAQGWSRAIEVVSARIESGVSDTHRCDNCEGVDPASCLTRSDR